MSKSVIDIINKLDYSIIADHRKDLLKPLHEYVIFKVKQKVEANLNFICTHNSRRSQIAQVWAKIMSDYYGFNINCFSGGTITTECNKRTIASFGRMGFMIKNPGGENPHYELTYHEKKKPIIVFSKAYDDAINPRNNFAAIMNFVIFPVFFLSGSLYPVSKLPDPLGILAKLNPYTYGVDLLKHSINIPMGGIADFTIVNNVVYLSAFTILSFFISSWRFSDEKITSKWFPRAKI